MRYFNATLIFLFQFSFSLIATAQSKNRTVKNTAQGIQSKSIITQQKGKLLISTDADCNFFVNGKTIGNLKAGKDKLVIGVFGDNKIEANLGFVVPTAPKKGDPKTENVVLTYLYKNTATIADTAPTAFKIEFFGSKLFYDYIRAGNKAMIEDCIKRNSNLVRGSEEELSPLLVAVQKEKIDLVELFLIKGADINQKTEETPLCAAIKMQKSDVAKLLITKGASLELNGEDNLTPLQLAVEYKKFEIVKILLEKGADKTIRDKQGRSLLKIAYDKGLDSIYEELKSAGVPE